ncbi:MAG: adenylate/guanylate cyclase domain-containing protein, partial [Planctomycetota bacterium]|nr:adenylate/guanylate cyclase domain-containing protein [Planctomycetota bacterium]
TLYSGVESHATAIDNILSGDFLYRDLEVEWWAIEGMIVIGGLLTVFAASYGGALAGSLAGLASLTFVIVGNYYFFFNRSAGYIVAVVYPFSSLLLIFVIVNAVSYFTVGREKRFIREAFSVYLSPVLVSQLERHPEKARSLRGEQKNLTVMFSDIRDFTSIAETMKPRQLSAFLNEYLTPMADIVMASGGTVDKFLGDALMAFWGAPLDDPHHAINGARAALRMVQKLEELQAQWRSRGLPEIRIGIGINTGLMSVGNMGSQQRLAYTVIGDNVNLASRLEGLNKNYGTTIIVSEATHKAIGDLFYSRCIDCVRVKGRQEPVRIYELLGEGEAPAELREEIKAFAEAFRAYQARRFAEAEVLIRRLQEKRRHRLYEEYLARLLQLQRSPPPPDWDGVFVYTHK